MFLPLPALQLIDSADDRLLHLGAAQVALVEHGIGPHGPLDNGILAVPLDEQGGGAVDVVLSTMPAYCEPVRL